ncbi:MAG: hypothetical protein COY66_01040 [Candidatus Kerfeldbacteria bacterium CG_4_10_14_0_8_um_filter_42_10]|uniref:Uncharacterized protein n=1 Tax=Candidatus Kerfeldbacteria bacterium CG_4_10_14_0_8_um_filter_42_10 TaxID=2014248 RepID=A0A2M7RK56_9BACT|nr:MAG: hypothetical protein COY66_01040 [Candidatus Kerfeldbacteria bacterium CG_4_10_14_0_8_um_filter_42_10]
MSDFDDGDDLIESLVKLGLIALCAYGVCKILSAFAGFQIGSRVTTEELLENADEIEESLEEDPEKEPELYYCAYCGGECTEDEIIQCPFCNRYVCSAHYNEGCRDCWCCD